MFYTKLVSYKSLSIFISRLFCFSFSDALSLNGSERASLSSSTTTSSSTQDSQSNQVMSDADLNHTIKQQQQPDFVDSSADEGILENCRILPSHCLPCLNTTTVPSIEKRRSLSSSPPSSRKKMSLKLSYKWREGHASGALCKYILHLIHWISGFISNQKLTCYLGIVSVFSKMQLKRPIAGSQVPFCPIDKKMLDCWSTIEPNSFRVRGKTYFR